MRQILRYFAFTKNEIKIIIFLVVVIVAGFSIKYTKFLIDISKRNAVNYDYSDENRKFLKYSRNALNSVLYDSLPQNDVYNKTDSILIEKMKVIEDSVKLKDESPVKTGKKEKYLKNITININTAGKDELVKLPGVGDAMAEKIIKYREAHKGFKKIEDIKKVKGIGKKKFEKMKPYIIVE